MRWNAALCEGRWGRGIAWLSERLRRALDLEDWPAFEPSFLKMAELLRDMAVITIDGSSVNLLIEQALPDESGQAGLGRHSHAAVNPGGADVSPPASTFEAGGNPPVLIRDGRSGGRRYAVITEAPEFHRWKIRAYVRHW